MLNNYSLSIVVPVYNLENDIQKTLNSILPQMNDDVELIVIDDGSTDSSGLIIKNYLDEYDFSFIKHENLGLYKTRIDSIKYLNSDYVWFVDGGDEITESSIKTILEKLKLKCDLYTFNYIKTDKNGNYDKKNYSPSKNIIEDLFLGKVPNSLWSKVFKTNILKEIKFVDDRLVMGEDMYISTSYLVKLENLNHTHIEEYLYNYIYTSNGITANKISEETVIVALKSIKETLIDFSLYSKYKTSFDYLCFNQLIIKYSLIDNFHKHVIKNYYNAFLKLNCDIKNNKYIKYGKICVFIAKIKSNNQIISRLITKIINSII